MLQFHYKAGVLNLSSHKMWYVYNARCRISYFCPLGTNDLSFNNISYHESCIEQFVIYILFPYKPTRIVSVKIMLNLYPTSNFFSKYLFAVIITCLCIQWFSTQEHGNKIGRRYIQSIQIILLLLAISIVRWVLVLKGFFPDFFKRITKIATNYTLQQWLFGHENFTWTWRICINFWNAAKPALKVRLGT